jgi:hypothetical protein
VRRVVTVFLVFALLTGVSGVDTASLGAEQATDKADAQRKKIAERVTRIPVNSVVDVRHQDGRRFRAWLQDKTADTITVVMLGKQARGDKEVIRLEQISRIDPVRDHTVRNVLIGVGVGVGVVFLALVSACAVGSTSTAKGPQGSPEEKRP